MTENAECFEVGGGSCEANTAQPTAVWGGPLERFSQSCSALASRHSVFHQVKPFRRGHMIDQTGLIRFL